MEKIRVIDVEVCEDFDAGIIDRMIEIEERKARRFVMLTCVCIAGVSAALLATDLRSLAFLFTIILSSAMIGKRI